MGINAALEWARQQVAAEGQQKVENAEAAAFIRKTAEDALKAAAADAEKASQAAAAEAAARSAENAKKQSIFDAVYAVAAADGSVSDAERAKLAAGLSTMLGAISENEAQSFVAAAKEYYDAHGLEGTGKMIADAVTDADGRRSLLILASAVAWLDRGVGTKEGLALQSLTRHFGFEIHELHKCMAAGKWV
ncbi:MAG: TerB family tellurite resistance protein [Polyangiaceae bacterium]